MQKLVEQRKANIIPGKTPWRSDRLNQASEKTINKLYKSINDEPKISLIKEKDLLSKLSRVNGFQGLISDINGNFLIKNKTLEFMGKLAPTFDYTPMGRFWAHMCMKKVVYTLLQCRYFVPYSYS